MRYNSGNDTGAWAAEDEMATAVPLNTSQLDLYACGLNAMVSGLVEAAERLGVPSEHTQFERFG